MRLFANLRKSALRCHGKRKIQVMQGIKVEANPSRSGYEGCSMMRILKGYLVR